MSCFYAAPIVGAYALFRVIQLAETPKSVPIFLSLVGLGVDIWTALFWLTMNF